MCILPAVQTNNKSIGWQALKPKGHWLIIQCIVAKFDGCERIENNPASNENKRYSRFLLVCFSKCLLHHLVWLILWTSNFYVNLSLNITVIESRSRSNKQKYCICLKRLRWFEGQITKSVSCSFQGKKLRHQTRNIPQSIGKKNKFQLFWNLPN